MSWSLFGFEIQRRNQADDEKEKRASFTPPPNDDGSTVVAEGNFYGTYMDLNGSISSESELITKYREMILYPDVEYAVDDIVCEAVTLDSDSDVVSFNMESFEDSSVFANKAIQDKINEEFKKVIELLDFNHNAYEIFKRWYVDGRLYYHVIIDDKVPDEGIKEFRYVDPRKIRKIKEVQRVRDPQGVAMNLTQLKSEYFVYSSAGFGKMPAGSQSFSQAGDAGVYGLKIASDSIIYAHSGVTDPNNNMILSYLHSAIRVLNALRSLEDSLVIYRFVRAPERRIFYIDVGSLPRQKAEQYMNDMMIKHKNKLVYDQSNGQIRDDRRFMCLDMETRVPLLDGRTLTLAEITAEYEAGKKNWVYSADPITGEFAPGPVSWAGVTLKNSPVVKVTFDNGKSVVCTPDHKFPVWGKGFVEAKDLVGESIIPGYRRMKKLAEGTTEYEQIYQNDTKTWEFTHRAVAKWKDENDLREEMTHLQEYANEKKRGVHPIHIKTWKIIPPDGDQIIVENLSAWCRDNGLNRTNIKDKFGSRGYHAEILRNHKAVSVEWLPETMDVGCLTVDLEETYHSNHTYLLDIEIYTKNTMFEDYWLPRREGCVSLTTKIKLLDGRDVELGQLIVEHGQGKQNWVYSVSPTGRVVPGKISWAGVTRLDAEVIDIELDDGEIITATPDHKFILRTGEKIEAAKLTVGSSLMPLNTRKEYVSPNNKGGLYDQVQHNDSESWEFVHRTVSENMHGERKNDDVVHHVDFTRTNNNPENLVYMNKKEHFLFHSRMGTNSWTNGDRESHVRRLSEAGKRFFASEEGIKRRAEISKNNRESEAIWKGFSKGRDTIKALREADKLVLSKDEYLTKWSPGLNPEMARKGAEAAVRKLEELKSNMELEAYSKMFSERNRIGYEKKTAGVEFNVLADTFREVLSGDVQAGNPELVDAVREHYPSFTTKKLRTYLLKKGYATIADFIARAVGQEYLNKRRASSVGSKTNHQVVKITKRSDLVDVGTLTIDEHHEHHDYHNFALSSGVFIMNSKGTQIETLPAGQNLGELTDVEYFQKKLYRALHVPISRMNPESSGFTFSKAAEISRDEVKFSRFIDRLRRRFSLLLFEALSKQLVLKNIIAKQEISELYRGGWFEFANDNHFAEIKDNEILSRRVEVAKDIQDFVGIYFSHDYVRRKILRQTDDDLEKLDNDIANEKLDPRYSPKPEGNGVDMGGGGGGDFPPQGFQDGDPSQLGAPVMPDNGQMGSAAQDPNLPQQPQNINSSKDSR